MNNVNTTKEYGISGDVLYGGWERKFEEIRKGVKFGKYSDEDAAYAPLKEEIVRELSKAVEEYNKMKPIRNWCITIAVLVFVIGAATRLVVPESIVTATLICAAPGIYAIMRMRSSSKKLCAVTDFDEKYFDGEIMFKWKNG